MPTPQPDQPTRVSAEHAVAQRSDPDEDGWISITADRWRKRISTRSEQAAATSEEAEPVDS